MAEELLDDFDVGAGEVDAGGAVAEVRGRRHRAGEGGASGKRTGVGAVQSQGDPGQDSIIEIAWRLAASGSQSRSNRHREITARATPTAGLSWSVEASDQMAAVGEQLFTIIGVVVGASMSYLVGTVSERARWHREKRLAS